MAVTSQETSQETTTDRFPLLMERVENNAIGEHVINIPRVGDDTSLHSSGDGLPHGSAPENVPSNSSSQLPATESPSSSNDSNYRSSSLTRNEEVLSRRWSPFNTVLWISIEVLFTLGQIIAAIVVLCLSRDEHPHTPLFAWVVGHVAGNLFSLPLYYWRYLHRNGVIDQRSSQESLPRSNSTSEPSSYITVSLTQTLGEEDGNNTSNQVLDGHDIESPHVRSYALIGNYKMALDCFFVVWFVVGNVWIFGGNSSSASDAPKLYRLCIVYLTFSCIGYALPFILCAMLCCCLPCIISVIGVREDNGLRGATDESINALPTHKFKMSKNGSGDDKGGVEDGGTVAAGTEKECAISGEDAVCCICLNEYEDGDELRELPCSHLFHTDCGDKWLKINASCPLCKSQIAVDVDVDVKNGNGNGNGNDNSTPVENSDHHQQQQG